ncbi:hypothetical protein [Amycolatopsis saalfeldensis]|uniref:Uncharacterized protein n=1 Tax=Amycolatopsis saalfeldensis TaxID=394193 RepID=A0A1H8X224_9PSEU|nr:hypothetical protein [Amycolatopsis saalfeldensis]SEP33881.1 hypothetical protein SAMN04489732_106174 [Amycolatopsis saalfeldensis]
MTAQPAVADGQEVLHELMMDLLVKGLIVLGAVVLLVLGAVVIWRRAGR